MLLTIEDAEKKTWPVKVDLKKLNWEASGGAGASGSPFGLFSKGSAVVDAGGKLRLKTALWDLQLIAAPTSEQDSSHSGGEVLVLNSKIGSWDRGSMRWVKGALAGAPAAGGGSVLKESDLLPQRTGKIRVDLEAALRALLPCSLGDKRWDVIEPGSEKDVAAGKYTKVGTSCVVLPKFVSQYCGQVPLGLGMPPSQARNKAMEDYMKRRSLAGTTTGRTKGRIDGSWVKADGIRLPRPGDIYCLLDRNSDGSPKTDRDNDYCGHVGVVLKASANVWETADLGQGTGWAGKIVTREYRKSVGSLFGEVLQTKAGQDPFRIVAGWVDLERYFPDYSKQLQGHVKQAAEATP